MKPDRFSIAENSANGTAIGSITPRNSHGANGLTFAIASGNTGGAFAIDPATGAVTVANAALLNFETLSTRWDDPASYQLFVTITDDTDPLLNETVRVVITKGTPRAAVIAALKQIVNLVEASAATDYFPAG